MHSKVRSVADAFMKSNPAHCDDESKYFPFLWFVVLTWLYSVNFTLVALVVVSNSELQYLLHFYDAFSGTSTTLVLFHEERKELNDCPLLAIEKR
jgi:hypothetical protein